MDFWPNLFSLEKKTLFGINILSFNLQYSRYWISKQEIFLEAPASNWSMSKADNVWLIFVERNISRVIFEVDKVSPVLCKRTSKQGLLSCDEVVSR